MSVLKYRSLLEKINLVFSFYKVDIAQITWYIMKGMNRREILPSLYRKQRQPEEQGVTKNIGAFCKCCL